MTTSTTPSLAKRITAAAAIFALVACSDFTPTARQVAPGVLAVDTAPGATIEVLDWGGAGTPIVFLAGGGHTAHQFDNFAPLLTDSFRVVGITRRGVGGSSEARHRFNRDRIRDIARVLEALDLESAVLIGHSQGGLEAAEFAQAYPQRCRGIVHLDSALLGGREELAEIFRSTPPPSPPERTESDNASIAAVQAWTEDTQGFRLSESELRAVNELDGTGRVLGPAPRDTGPRYGWPGQVPELRWEAVECPALGLYPVTAPLETWLPFYRDRFDTTTPEERSQADAYYRAFSSWTAERRAEFGGFPQNRVVEYPGSGHYFFLNERWQADTLEDIRDFLAELE
ncbi:MAG: alpha/beta hydrolase [Gemmatimonadota bacterium]